MLKCLWDLVTWPLRLLGEMLGWVLSLMGNMIGFCVGGALALGGAIACLTIVGAFAGIPLLLIGGGLMLKCIF
ncbi:MAG: hypothetical protein IJ507_06255 [Clostridia bacterium]|nr:hypothetical protein [Clostridia bacterium]